MSSPVRKPLRLKEYDYSTPGYYFVTVCTHEKKCLFGQCVGAIHESPVTRLSPYGIVVNEVIQSIPARFRNVLVDKYVIMPNHVHLILKIVESGGLVRAIRESPLQPKRRSTYSKVVGYFKATTSKEIHRRFQNGIVLWQRGSYDHIIRNNEDYQRIWQYIDTNPLKWELDCYYKEQILCKITSM